MNNEIVVPQHVAIIPDGNRRWAKDKGEDPWVGHQVAADNLEHIMRRAQDHGVKYLTLWGSSRENLMKRPIREKAELLRIYSEYFKRLMSSEEIIERGVRIHVLGRWRETFPAQLVKLFERGIQETARHTEFHLTLCLDYSGDDEMLGAINKILASQDYGEDVTPQILKAHLMTRDLPPVDYLIRTGGEPHLSVGFMMWDIANAQLYFTEMMCPDFDADAFEASLTEYAERARRHGA